MEDHHVEFHPLEYYLDIQMKEMLMFAMVWIKLENIMMNWGDSLSGRICS